MELGEGQSFVVAGLVNNQEIDIFQQDSGSGQPSDFRAVCSSPRTRRRQRTDLVVMVTPEITEPLGPNDPKPNIYMPKDFLVRLDPKDMPPPTTSKKKK